MVALSSLCDSSTHQEAVDGEEETDAAVKRAPVECTLDPRLRVSPVGWNEATVSLGMRHSIGIIYYTLVWVARRRHLYLEHSKLVYNS